MLPARRSHPWSPFELVSRSLFPIAAMALLGSVVLFGPWVFLILTYAWWRLVTRIG